MINTNTNWEKDRQQLINAMEQLLKVRGIVSHVIKDAGSRKIMLPIAVRNIDITIDAIMEVVFKFQDYPFDTNSSG